MFSAFLHRLVIAAPVLSLFLVPARDGRWLKERNWTGDQVDSELNFPAEPVVLKVRIGRC